MYQNYELKVKECEENNQEVLVATNTDENGKKKEFCLCSHLCKSPCLDTFK